MWVRIWSDPHSFGFVDPDPHSEIIFFNLKLKKQISFKDKVQIRKYFFFFLTYKKWFETNLVIFCPGSGRIDQISWIRIRIRSMRIHITEIKLHVYIYTCWSTVDVPDVGVEVGNLLFQLGAVHVRVGHSHHDHTPTQLITKQ